MGSERPPTEPPGDEAYERGREAMSKSVHMDLKREDSYREMMVKLGTAVILAESAAYRVPIKQENRTPEEQAAVEDFSSSWVSIRAILREYEAFGRADALARVSAHRAGEGELTPCPCGEPVPEGYPPCTFEKPCPYAEGMPESRWAQRAGEGEEDKDSPEGGERYETPEEAEWVQPVEEGYKMACCDCGLVHRMDFRVEDGRAQFRAFRANRSTAMMRRHRKARAARQPDRKDQDE